jgi:hypothetical protein
VLIKEGELFPTQYRATYNAAAREYQQILTRIQGIDQERAQLQQRLQYLEGTMKALQPLCEDEAEQEQVPALAAVCQHALLNYARPATGPEIRALVSPMINLTGYKNPLAMIHMALKRTPGVNCFKGTDGKTYYEWYGTGPAPGGF